MEQLLFTGGTAWETAPPPRGLRPATLEFLAALVATQAGPPACCHVPAPSLGRARLSRQRRLEHASAPSPGGPAGNRPTGGPFLLGGRSCLHQQARVHVAGARCRTHVALCRQSTRSQARCIYLAEPPHGLQAELAATAPALLSEALEELVLGTFDGLAQVGFLGL